LSSETVRVSAADRSQEKPLGNSVLIVDDDVNLARLLRTILRTAGYQVLTASDGEEALRMLDDASVDVIVLDLRMPRMDGREFFRELKARRNHAPVLIASAYGARTAQLELGADAAIEKPFEPDRLVDAVTELLQQTGPRPA